MELSGLRSGSVVMLGIIIYAACTEAFCLMPPCDDEVANGNSTDGYGTEVDTPTVTGVVGWTGSRTALPEKGNVSSTEALEGNGTTESALLDLGTPTMPPTQFNGTVTGDSVSSSESLTGPTADLKVQLSTLSPASLESVVTGVFATTPTGTASPVAGPVFTSSERAQLIVAVGASIFLFFCATCALIFRSRIYNCVVQAACRGCFRQTSSTGNPLAGRMDGMLWDMYDLQASSLSSAARENEYDTPV
jgi:hypothetical protein